MARTVELNFDADAVLDALEEAAGYAIEEAVAYVKEELKSRIPGNRTKTRRHIIGEADGLEGEAGVRFPPGERYDERGTMTEKILDTIFDAIEDEIVSKAKDAFHNKLRELQ